MLDCIAKSHVWLHDPAKSNMIVPMIIPHFIKLDMGCFHLLFKLIKSLLLLMLRQLRKPGPQQRQVMQF